MSAVIQPAGRSAVCPPLINVNVAHCGRMLHSGTVLELKSITGFNEYVFIPICVVKHQKNEVLMWSQSVHLSSPTCSPDRAAANFITAVNIHALPPGQVILSLRTNNSSDPKCTLESIMFCSSVKNVASFTVQ